MKLSQNEILTTFHWILRKIAIEPRQISPIIHKQYNTSVPKNGVLSKAGNQLSISINAISAKLVNRLKLNRIQRTLDKNLRSNQNFFRPGRSMKKASKQDISPWLFYSNLIDELSSPSLFYSNLIDELRNF